jgi:hypothetical protein
MHGGRGFRFGIAGRVAHESGKGSGATSGSGLGSSCSVNTTERGSRSNIKRAEKAGWGSCHLFYP